MFSRVTFLSRFALSLPDLCSNIRNIIDFNIDQSSAQQKQVSRTRSGIKSNYKIKSSEAYIKIESEFNQQSKNAFQIWSTSVGRICIQSVDDIFGNEKDFDLLSLTNWENIEIDEESEAGKSMKTTIKVPAQVNIIFQAMVKFKSFNEPLQQNPWTTPNPAYKIPGQITHLGQWPIILCNPIDMA